MTVFKSFVVVFFLCYVIDTSGQLQPKYPTKNEYLEALLAEFGKRSNFSFFEHIAKASFFGRNWMLEDTDTANDKGTCLNSISDVRQGFLNKEVWALQYIDAWGKLPAGLLQGAISWVGDYEQCKTIDMSYANITLPFQPKYCLSALKFNLSGIGVEEMTFLYGMCVPDSCSENETKRFVSEGATELLGDLEITWFTCQGKDNLDAHAIFAIVFLSAFGLLVFIATLLDVLIHQRSPKPTKEIPLSTLAKVDPSSDTENHNALQDDAAGKDTDVTHSYSENTRSSKQGILLKIVLCFSAYTNGSKLLSTRTEAGTLSCIHGIRFFSMSWIILAHTYFFASHRLEQKLQISYGEYGFLFLTINNASFSVDTFFVISGLLVTYLFLKDRAASGSPKKSTWVMFYLHRYWRLTPTYMIVLAFYTCLFAYLGDGPTWATADALGCRTSWYRHLLYVNWLDTKCMGWSWYLAMDMQLYWMSPLILMGLYKKKYCGFTGIVIFIIVHILCSVVFAILGKAKIYESAWQVYFSTPCRCGAYAIGMAVGYVLVRNEERRYRFKKWQVICNWLFAAFLCLAPLYGLEGYYRDRQSGTEWPNAKSVTYIACSRISWSLGIAILIFNCINGYGGIINNLLSWKVLIPLSRLTYCAYLIHPIMMMAFYYSRRRLVYVNHWTLVTHFFGFMVQVYMAAAVVSLALEAPFFGLEKLVLSKLKLKTHRK